MKRYDPIFGTGYDFPQMIINPYSFASGSPPPSPFPQILSVTEYGEGSAAATSHTRTLPSGIVSGQMLLIINRLAGGTSQSNVPSGWTQVTGTVLNALTTAFYRIADGSETEVIISQNANTRVLSTLLVISPAAAVAGSFNTTTADPPSLSPSWGSDDNLWLAVGSLRSTDAVSSYNAPPSGFDLVSYTETNDGGSDNTTECQLFIASREEAAATVNPSAWGITGTASVPRSGTFAIQP
jgi:hypothetical protein